MRANDFISVLAENFREGLADDLLRRQSETFGILAVYEQVSTVAIALHEHDRRRVRNEPEL